MTARVRTLVSRFRGVPRDRQNTPEQLAARCAACGEPFTPEQWAVKCLQQLGAFVHHECCVHCAARRETT